MKIVTNNTHGILEVTTAPDPKAAEKEVLLQIHASAINRADLMQCEGNYPPPPGWPEWPGLEASGIVLEAPANCRFRPGDRVCALLGGGGYAEKIAVAPELLLPIPPGVSMEEAAAIPEVFATAYLNFVLEANVQPGETVFIHAGASGLGLAAIQLAKLFGCKVLTTVGSEEKARVVRSFGADIAINTNEAGNALEDALDACPPDIALDCVAGPKFGTHLAKMNPRGRWIIIAALGGPTSTLSLDTLFRKNLRIIGSTLRSRSLEQKAALLDAMEKRLWPHFGTGELRPNVYTILPMKDAARGHEILRNRANIGKVVLRWEET